MTDPMRPARGIVTGLLLSLVMWVCLIAVFVFVSGLR